MFFNANTEGNQNAVPTKESVNTRRMLAKALMESSSRVKPIDHWLQGVAQLGDGLAGAYLNSKADKQTQAGKDSIKSESDSLMSALFNRANPPKSDGGDIYGNVSLGAHSILTPNTEPNSSALPQSFLAALDKNEGGGNYDTLFGNAQNKGPFAGTKISGMTIGDALKFSDPSGDYANSVNQQIGRVATPMGRHQIVGTTLRNASQQMGLDPSTPFDQGTQDSIAMHLAKTRVASADTMGGKINALRQEWEGLKNVTDAQMAQIVSDIENGDQLKAVQNAANQQPVQIASNDPQFMPASAPPIPDNAQSQQIPQPSSSVAQVQPSPAAQTPPQMQIGSPEIMQKAIHVIQSEWADDALKAMAQHYLDVGMKQQQDAQDPLRQIQMQAAQQGVDKGAIELNQLRNPEPPKPIEVGGRLIDPETYKPVYEPPVVPDKPTANMQDYNFYADGEKKAGRVPLGPLQYEQEIKKAGASNVTTNVGGVPGDDELRKNLQKKEGEAWSGYADSATVSGGTMQDMQILDELVTLAPQGPITGRLAAAFPGVSSAADAFQSVIKRVAPTLRASGSGSTSDIEYDGMLKSLPSLSNQPEANSMISQIMKAKAQINIERGQIVAAYSNGEIDAPSARKQMNEINKRSIMSPEMKKAFLGLGGSAPSNGVDPELENALKQYGG